MPGSMTTYPCCPSVPPCQRCSADRSELSQRVPRGLTKIGAKWYWTMNFSKHYPMARGFHWIQWLSGQWYLRLTKKTRLVWPSASSLLSGNTSQTGRMSSTLMNRNHSRMVDKKELKQALSVYGPSDQFHDIFIHKRDIQVTWLDEVTCDIQVTWLHQGLHHLAGVDRYIQVLWYGSGWLDSGVIWAVSIHGLQHCITLAFASSNMTHGRRTKNAKTPFKEMEHRCR